MEVESWIQFLLIIITFWPLVFLGGLYAIQTRREKKLQKAEERAKKKYFEEIRKMPMPKMADLIGNTEKGGEDRITGHINDTANYRYRDKGFAEIRKIEDTVALEQLYTKAYIR